MPLDLGAGGGLVARRLTTVLVGGDVLPSGFQGVRGRTMYRGRSQVSLRFHG